VTFGEKIILVCLYGYVILFAGAAVFPFWLILIGSFAPEKYLVDGYRILYPAYTLSHYQFVLRTGLVFVAYRNTLIVAVSGVLLGLAITVPFAYVLSNTRTLWATLLGLIAYVPMILGSHLVGFYITVRMLLHLTNTYAALILPYVFNPFHVFLLVTYLRTLPTELLDAARIDGAGEWGVFWNVALPTSTPIIATVGLFYALLYWNDWWLPLLFADNPKMHTLQMMLQQMQWRLAVRDYVPVAFVAETIPTFGVRLVSVIVTIGPVILVYPFVQRYFIRGIMLGALKG
jgi:multiple sugar transport system permease protein/putative aldouronate transport system permease protein